MDVTGHGKVSRFIGQSSGVGCGVTCAVVASGKATITLSASLAFVSALLDELLLVMVDLQKRKMSVVSVKLHQPSMGKKGCFGTRQDETFWYMAQREVLVHDVTVCTEFLARCTDDGFGPSFYYNLDLTITAHCT